MNLNKLLILLSSFLILFIGTYFLQRYGYSYSMEDGSALEKFHPSTYGFLIGLVFYFLNKKNLFGTLKNSSLQINYLVVIIFLMIYLLVNNNFNSVSFIIDTLCVPVFFQILVANQGQNLKRKLYSMIIWFFVINSIIAILERVLLINIFDVAYNVLNGSRATALQGHPLNNALITATVMAFILVMDTNIYRKRILLILGYAALLSFGARGSLIVFTIGLLLFWVLPQYKKSIGLFYKLRQRKYFSNFLFLLIPILIVPYLIINTFFGERLRELTLYDTDSAGVRMKTLGILDRVTFDQVFFGINSDKMLSIGKLDEIDIIENFWIILILRFGLIFLIPIIYLLLRMMFKLLNKNKISETLLIIFIFFGVASTNNSLATNTTAITLFFMCGYAFQSSNSAKIYL